MVVCFSEFSICALNENAFILKNSICDGIPDCPNGEDETREMGCSSE